MVWLRFFRHPPDAAVGSSSGRDAERAAPQATPPSNEATNDGSATSWTARLGAPFRQPRRQLGVSLLAATLLGVGAWHGAGAVFAAQDRQETANHWANLERCLLGSGLEPGQRPSVRLAALDVAQIEQPTSDAPEHRWPERCLPHARALDQALASAALRDELGPQPSAASIVHERDRARRGAQLDALWARLRAADLPLAQPESLTAAEPVTRTPSEAAPAPLLRLSAIEPLARLERLADLVVSTDRNRGRALRLLLPSGDGSPPRLCRFDPIAGQPLWAHGECRALAASIPPKAVRWRLAHAEPGAVDLVYARTASAEDGFYEPSSGQRIWRPRSEGAQAVVRPSGQTTMVFALPRRSAHAETDHYRLVRLRPGQTPSHQRLKLAKDAQTLLLSSMLLWWKPTEQADALFAQALIDADPPIGKPQPAGTLPPRSTFLADCASEDVLAVLVASPEPEPRYALVLRERGVVLPPVPVGSLHAQPTLHCNGNEAVLVHRGADGIVVQHRCSSAGCHRSASKPLGALELPQAMVALGALGPKALVVWNDAGSLRMRAAGAESLHEAAEVPLVTADRPVAELGLVAQHRVAMLLVRDREGQVRAVHLGSEGHARAVQLAE